MLLSHRSVVVPHEGRLAPVNIRLVRSFSVPLNAIETGGQRCSKADPCEGWGIFGDNKAVVHRDAAVAQNSIYSLVNNGFSGSYHPISDVYNDLSRVKLHELDAHRLNLSLVQSRLSPTVGETPTSPSLVVIGGCSPKVREKGPRQYFAVAVYQPT